MAHYTEKKRLDRTHRQVPFFTEPAPLQRIFVLIPQTEMGANKSAAINAISPRDAFMELVKYSYRLEFADRKGLKAEFYSLGSMAASLECRQLTYHRDLSRLATIHKAILRDLGEK